jgi:hypothetical protein
MKDLNRSEFQDWKNNPVTETVFLRIAERIRETERILGTTAGMDTSEDRYRVGTIQAYKNLLEIDWEDLSDE